MKRIALLALLLAGCHQPSAPAFTAPMTLGGKRVEPAQLERGRAVYTQYCRACHGDSGRGDGPASSGLRPPPRDFTRALFKFGGTLPDANNSPTLPRDEDLARIVRGGLHGSAMLAWDLSDPQLDDVIQYLKTLSPRWQKESPGLPLVPSADPFAQRDADGVALGKRLYHGLAQCSSCHPAYASRAEIVAAAKSFNPGAEPVLRDDLYSPSPVDSPELSLDGVHPLRILPPDFLHRPLKSVRANRELDDVYRVLSLGIQGSGMPPWRSALTEEQLWALAHYVRSLSALKDTPAADALTARIAAENASRR